jgi:hypothetical protein
MNIGQAVSEEFNNKYCDKIILFIKDKMYKVWSKTGFGKKQFFHFKQKNRFSLIPIFFFF